MYNFSPVFPEAVPSVTNLFCAAVKSFPFCVQVIVGLVPAGSNWYEHVIVTGSPLFTFGALATAVTAEKLKVKSKF